MRLPGQLAAAIEVLADIEARHRPVSEALRDWGLSHRFAGASDRAIIGNLVYDVLRKRSSLGWRMGGESPWHLIVGVAVLEWKHAPEELNAAFAGNQHAPPPIPDGVIAHLKSHDIAAAPDHVRADVPEWLAPQLQATFGDAWVDEGAALAGRPPLDLRVNTLKADRDKVARQLAHLGARPTAYSPIGLRIASVEGSRRHPNVQAEEAFQRGRFEIQDEGSQLAAQMVGALPGDQVLDLCAGAGGKTLAIAAQMENRGQVYAHDSDKNRLAPIFDRLKRAGARNVQVRAPGQHALDDLRGGMDRVLVDAPCTGTGIWRRRPDAKWRLTAAALAKRTEEQASLLSEAEAFVKPGGTLTYTTCSLLRPENDERVAAFLSEHPHFHTLPAGDVWRGVLPAVAVPEAAAGGVFLLLTPRLTATDGFFVACLRRAA